MGEKGMRIEGGLGDGGANEQFLGRHRRRGPPHAHASGSPHPDGSPHILSPP